MATFEDWIKREDYGDVEQLRRAYEAGHADKSNRQNEKVSCNKENGSFSALWERKCWVADSFASLLQSHIETIAQKYPDVPMEPFSELNRYCEELRIKNGLRRDVGQAEKSQLE